MRKLKSYTVRGILTHETDEERRGGSFARSYPLSRVRVDGVLRAEGKLLHLVEGGGVRIARAC